MRPVLFLVLASASALAESGPTSPFAPIRPVSLKEVRWTTGFWAERFELCRTQMVPRMWALMEGTNYSQFFHNFRIAAGQAEGRHRGAPFNDGDFYKWLEAAAASLAQSKDSEWDQRLNEIIEVIARAQRQDGYLHTSVLIRQRNGDTNARPFQDPLQFELYNMGHLLSAASVHYRVTGKTNLLAIAQRAADFLATAFREPSPELARHAICPSHYMGLADLYRTTHEPRYLELLQRLFGMRNLVTDGTDDNQDRLPFEQQTNAIGHAVRANYLYAGAADLFAETGDRVLWNTLERIWTNVVEQKLYITGGCGGLFDGASPDGAKNQKSISRVHQAYGRNYQLPNLTAHNETCANIGNVLWNWRMFLATGEARFMDVVELALYNSVLSGASLDGTNFFYVNPLRSSEPLPVELRWPHQRVPFMNSFCCPPNLVRTLAEACAYAYSVSADAVWVNLYGGSELTTKLPGGSPLRLVQETEYPWNGRVRLTVQECGQTPLALKLRFPGWARSASVRVNNQSIEAPQQPASYLELRRAWQAGDAIELELPMPARLMEANPMVEETLNQLALKRGPLIYCLESTDLLQKMPLSRIALPVNLDLVARYDRRLLGGVTVLEGTVLSRSEEKWEHQLYREFHPASMKSVNTRFIPYFAWANRGQSEMSVWLPIYGSGEGRQ